MILFDSTGSLYDDAHGHRDDYSPSGSDAAPQKSVATSAPSAAPTAAQIPAEASGGPPSVVRTVDDFVAHQAADVPRRALSALAGAERLIESALRWMPSCPARIDLGIALVNLSAARKAIEAGR